MDIFLENDFVELKKSFNDSVVESLVAFSNFKNYGLPDLEIYLYGTGFGIIAYSKEFLLNGGVNDPLNEPLNEPLNDPLNLRQKNILEYIVKNPNVKREKIVEIMKVSLATVKRDIEVLINLNLIERKGSKKTGGYFRK